jgi:uncharacterized membrane protein YdjX (TVP38/TMEM64 family)
MKTDLFSVRKWLGPAEQKPVDPDSPPITSGFFQRYRMSLLLALVVLFGGIALWRYGPALQEIISDRARFQAFVDELGWYGPIVLVFFNALQIVVAPVPGYIVQLAAGYLYGTWWGGLWSTLGVFVGSMTAMWLARTYGRPLVERVIGAHRLHHWEDVIHSDSIYIWFILLLGPTGDAPFYLAGLAQVRFVHIALITLLLRVPSLFVAAAVGAGTVVLTWWQFSLILVAVGLFAFVLLQYKAFLAAQADRLLKKLAQRYASPGTTAPDGEQPATREQ